jgi:hypothetical protein
LAATTSVVLNPVILAHEAESAVHNIDEKLYTSSAYNESLVFNQIV